MYRISALVEDSNTSHLTRESVGRLKRREGRQEGEEPAHRRGLTYASASEY